MEDNNSINSCLMLAMGLYTPVDLGSIFDSADYKGTGLELDTHITLLYAQGKILPRKMILNDLKTILGESWPSFDNMIKDITKEKVFKLFDLSNFENDSDYLVLKLKKESDIYENLKLINLSLRKKYNVGSDFSEYSPHITLAELVPGTSKKYLDSECLIRVLENSLIDFEDIIISHGLTGEVNDRKQYFLTNYKCVDRYFRLRNDRENNKNLE